MCKKTIVEKKISLILKKYPIKSKLDNNDTEYIFSILEKSSTYSYINKQHYYLYIDYYKIKDFKKIKMIFANNGSRKIPIPKGKLIGDIFPSKSKLSKEDIHISNVKRAARNIISPQIKLFRETIELPIMCPISCKKLTNWRFIHIDHIHPFSELFSNWLDSLGISPLEIKLSGTKNNKTFQDENLRFSWYNFHERHAKLQCLYSKANLEKSNKIYTI